LLELRRLALGSRADEGKEVHGYTGLHGSGSAARRGLKRFAFDQNRVAVATRRAYPFDFDSVDQIHALGRSRHANAGDHDPVYGAFATSKVMTRERNFHVPSARTTTSV
jgi:hypothetical protein